MKGLTAMMLLGVGVAGCADLSRPHAIRTSKESGLAPQAPAAPNDAPPGAAVPRNLVTIPGPDGKPILVPRLNPPGHPNAGMPAE